MSYGIKIHSGAFGGPSQHDGRWLRFYDPTRNGVHGRIESTDNPAEAKQFPDIGAALREYRREYGTRPDRRPNRPLTAYTVSIDPLPEKHL